MSSFHGGGGESTLLWRECMEAARIKTRAVKEHLGVADDVEHDIIPLCFYSFQQRRRLKPTCDDAAHTICICIYMFTCVTPIYSKWGMGHTQRGRIACREGVGSTL